MKDAFSNALSRFHGAVNLLVVDDDLHILNAMERTFASPVFNKTAIESFAGAVKAIPLVKSSWHCWLLDIDLGENKTGIDVIKAFPRFPFVIVLSGLQSMHIAAEAVYHGAMAVFDKTPDGLRQLFDETCKAAALGFVLGGRHTQYLSTYRLLCSTVIETPEEWAEKACVSLRQLHRICDLHPVTSPRATLALYYTVYTLLLKGKPPFGDALPPAITQEHAEYVRECFKYTLKNN